MKQKLGVGIRQNSVQAFFSGARVAFDPRTTEEVEKSRDPKNYRNEDRMYRKALWLQRENQRDAAE